MLFADSETQKLLRDTARSYLADKYSWERLYGLESGDAPLTSEEISGMAGLGWFGLVAPESAGGGGASLLEAAVIIEELGYAGVAAPVAVANIAAYFLIASGTGADHLPALASGARLYTASESTRRHGPDRAPPPTLEGGRLTDLLPCVPFGAAADFVLTPASSNGEAAFVLAHLDGVQREPVRVLDRADYADLHFEKSAAVVLASGSKAEDLHGRCDALTTAFALIELAGLLQRATEMTAEYISNRVQFGVPISKFQAARHHAADMLIQAQTTRWTAYHALSGFGEDPENTKEIWLARHWAIRASQIVFELAHLLHGGVGVGREYPLHLFTQGAAAFAVRAGAINEMVERVNTSLGLRQASAA